MQHISTRLLCLMALISLNLVSAQVDLAAGGVKVASRYPPPEWGKNRGITNTVITDQGAVSNTEEFIYTQFQCTLSLHGGIQGSGNTLEIVFDESRGGGLPILNLDRYDLSNNVTSVSLVCTCRVTFALGTPGWYCGSGDTVVAYFYKSTYADFAPGDEFAFLRLNSSGTYDNHGPDCHPDSSTCARYISDLAGSKFGNSIKSVALVDTRAIANFTPKTSSTIACDLILWDQANYSGNGVILDAAWIYDTPGICFVADDLHAANFADAAKSLAIQCECINERRSCDELAFFVRAKLYKYPFAQYRPTDSPTSLSIPATACNAKTCTAVGDLDDVGLTNMVEALALCFDRSWYSPNPSEWTASPPPRPSFSPPMPPKQNTSPVDVQSPRSPAPPFPKPATMVIYSPPIPPTRNPSPLLVWSPRSPTPFFKPPTNDHLRPSPNPSPRFSRPWPQGPKPAQHTSKPHQNHKAPAKHRTSCHKSSRRPK